MERVTSNLYAQEIGYALEVIPKSIRTKIDYVHFLTGTDPIYAGLFKIEDEKLREKYRYLYYCCAYPFHQEHLSINKRNTTVVLPRYINGARIYIVHELGHVLDEYLGFNHIAEPVTKYAETNRMESFAEAFTSWLFYDYGKEPDRGTIQLFESL